MATNRDCKKSHGTDLRMRRKKSKGKYTISRKTLSIQVSGKSDVVLVDGGKQVVNKYFNDPNVMISSNVSTVYVMNVSLVGVNINQLKLLQFKKKESCIMCHLYKIKSVLFCFVLNCFVSILIDCPCNTNNLKKNLQSKLIIFMFCSTLTNVVSGYVCDKNTLLKKKKEKVKNKTHCKHLQ